MPENIVYIPQVVLVENTFHTARKTRLLVSARGDRTLTFRTKRI